MPLDKKCLIKACLTVMILSACANSSQSPIAVEKGGLVDVAEITQNVESFIGHSVLVRNDVKEKPVLVAEKIQLLNREP